MIPNPYCGGWKMIHVKPSEMFNGKLFYLPFYTMKPICSWRVKSK